MEKKNLKTISNAELDQVTGGRGAARTGGNACASITNPNECIQAGCCWYENVACVSPSNVIRGVDSKS